MDMVLFGGVTLKHALIVIAALAVAGPLLRAIGKKSPAEKEHLVEKRCSACNWSGKVSKFNTKCPKCTKPLK